MSDRIQTGSAGLDTILQGGFLRHNSILLKGAPGTGKTSLGIQVLLEGIRQGEGAIVCSFEQFPQQLHRDTRAFGWDLQALVDEGKLAILFISPEDLVNPTGSNARSFISRVYEMAEGVTARRLLLDSLTHFNRLTESPAVCRKMLLDFINDMKSIGLTPMLTAELHESTHREFTFEEYLVDEVVLLHNDLAGSTAALPQRSIEVAKSRGHAHAPGRHPFRFGPSGIEVFPHILPEPGSLDEAVPDATEPLSTGVGGADKILGGGYPRGCSTMVAGTSGSYKTTLAASFLAECPAHDQRGLLIGFEESPSQLLPMLAHRGVDLEAAVRSGHVTLRHYVPRKSNLDAIFDELQRDLETQPYDRVVIDSIDDFERSIDDPNAYKDYLGMFLARLRRAGATTLITQKIDRVSGSNPLADIRYCSMVDGIVYLGSVEIESEIHHVVSALKSRGGAVEGDLREITCDSQGLKIGHKFHGLSGILQGTARGQFKKSVENIFQPLYFVRDFARMGSGEKVADAQRRKILEDIQTQLGQLDDVLKDYFGFDPEEEKRR